MLSCKKFKSAFCFYRTTSVAALSNRNQSVQRCFSEIFYAQLISDNLPLPQRQTNLKMHSLIKNLFQWSAFVTDLEPTPPLSEMWSKHWLLTTLLFFCTSEKLRYLVKSSIFQCFQISLFWFWLECFLLYQTTKVFLAFTGRSITSAPFSINW